ncbi:MAG: hypothetical protein ACI9JL_002810 [Paracoccaceae bacterium]|jgi:hypothetical protein
MVSDENDPEAYFDPASFTRRLAKELEAYDTGRALPGWDCSDFEREAYDAIRESIIDGYRDVARKHASLNAIYWCV